MAVYYLARLLVLALALRLASPTTHQCPADMALEEAGCDGPDLYICTWQQGTLRKSNSSKTGPDSSNYCVFVVRDPAFLDILAFDSKLELIAHADAHEGGVYNPDDDSFYFSTTKQLEPKPNTKIMKVHLISGKVEVVKEETEVANGMVLDKEGHLLVCHQGVGEGGGYIERLNLASLESTIVADNWFGHPFNSPNDAVIKSDGSIWFTDPDYGWVQGFKKAPQLNNQLYRVSPTGVVDAVADGFVKPNGLAFSHDERRLYVSDTGSTLGDKAGNVMPSHPHSITVFDVAEDGTSLLYKRLFASVSTLDGSYRGVGCPDGIKVDTMGRVYVANPDGIQVLSPEGKVLGMIRVNGAVNMGFAGENLDNLIILNDTAIHGVHLSAQGAGLHFASSGRRRGSTFS